MIATSLIPMPLVVSAIKENKPQSILDIGCGFGRYGFLFRETLDASFQDKQSFTREHWTRKIDAVEVCAEYITELQKHIYNQIFIGNIIEIIDKDILGNYDIIFMGDLIEHLTKQDGWRLLNWAYAKANKMVIITTPSFFMCDPEDKEYDRHKSLWQPADFRKFPNKKILILENRVLCAFLVKPNVELFLPVFQGSPFINLLGKIIRQTLGRTHLGAKVVNFIRNAKENLYYKKF